MSANAMHVAKTGLNAQQSRIQVISNNLANVNTTGFKRDRANFESLLYQVHRPAGAQTSEATRLTTPSAIGTGVRMVSTDKLYTQGGLSNTGNALDLAVDGKGFFQVLMPDGRIGYTRNGALSMNAEGTLTTASGYVVQPEIQIPADAQSITISGDGIVSVMLPGEVDAQEVGQLTLATFANPRGLQPVGETLAVETVASGAPAISAPMADAAGKLTQGMLESSNVNVVQELVDMIEAQRAYEVNSKSISASDEMMRFLSNNL
ncbi:flagellar basal-body rod protein FlgG [Rhodovulum bhavnagarense]|uniref:Flagellar basal-body rod protein FlgG n=1 Tax=Rhodovulum bhavnagarense TaxID=992286 RepID=A0A4R2RGW4_9RHOB|nr:flagellar basal-body rod protein FlgG [Rhodovulum bhavnagarense]TCP61347.1 flagellar basal-body rod protein FlgG [Rhodovulum bhavnagarense]